MKFENSKSAKLYSIGFLAGTTHSSLIGRLDLHLFFVLVGRFRMNLQAQSTVFFCQKVSGIHVLIEDSTVMKTGESLEVTEEMVSNAFHTKDKVTLTIHQSLK